MPRKISLIDESPDIKTVAIENADIGKTSLVDESPDVKRENARSKIATYYIIGFLIIVAATILIGFAKGNSVNENKDMLLTISAVLSGPLGFIIGYYFKGQE